MRLSTASRYEAGVSELQRRQQALGEAQERLVSGKRVERASDDPVAAARAERASARLSISTASLRALDASRAHLTLSENTLGQSAELLQEARDLMVSAGNGSYSDAERGILADSLRGLREQLLNLANRGDGNGSYLFGGQGSAGEPFVEGAGGVSYRGTPGDTQLAVGEARLTSAVDGDRTWTAVPDSSGATINVFDALAAMADELDTPGRSSAAIATANTEALRVIDRVLLQQGQTRSAAGEALNRLDGIEQRLGQQQLDAEQVRSDATDLDMVAAISDFQNQQTGYNAALQAYAQVQRLSLFDYLKG
ncbi:flagellar hook-associated protein FlgL [Piscinibacter sp. Jin2]|uniref:Flagellar hook-associated protein FlgL n=1 Tax=Aquariibacter lacus TaxID=2801332 RepID=A0A9X0XES1_9BURK|nr:flagellar hook-associated protein FlgL [Piscinibacter lacus]MBL0719527.1 flagellar hook-associated protein FlgL [Piscinibacter lacus]